LEEKISSKRKTKATTVEVPMIKRRRRKLLPELLTMAIPKEPKAKSEIDDKIENSHSERFNWGKRSGLESSRLVAIRLISNTVVLMLMSRRLSERGLLRANLPISFMNRPMNIRNAMLNPHEKRAFSAVSKFFSSNSFKRANPGTNIK
jgi:hypothetical protein